MLSSQLARLRANGEAAVESMSSVIVWCQSAARIKRIQRRQLHRDAPSRLRQDPAQTALTEALSLDVPNLGRRLRVAQFLPQAAEPRSSI
jgi:hypothetical protein